MLAHKDGLLDLRLLHAPVLAHLNDSLTVLLGNHAFVLHLFHLFLDALVIALLQSHDFSGTFLSLFDLLPCLHLLLFEQSNTVGQKLRIPLDTKKEKGAFTK